MKHARLGKIPSKYRKDVQSELRVISQTIQDRRKALGLTQEALAEKLDIAPTTLQFIEQGRRYPSLPMLAHICVVMKMKIQLS